MKMKKKMSIPVSLQPLYWSVALTEAAAFNYKRKNNNQMIRPLGEVVV